MLRIQSLPKFKKINGLIIGVKMKRVLSSFFMLLVFQAISITSLTDSDMYQGLRIGMGTIDGPRKVVSFCIPKSYFKKYRLDPPLMSYGSELRKDIQVSLVGKDSDKKYWSYEVFFNSELVVGDGNIFVRFPFIPLVENMEELTLFYNVADIESKIDLSKVTAIKNTYRSKIVPTP
jgi:hypothetical protein